MHNPLFNRSNFTRFRNDGAATSAIEFAMLAPIFILLLLGMVAYGIYFGASHSVQQIAADAARTALSGLDQAERQSLATAFVQRNAAGYPFIDPGKISVTAQDSTADADQFVVAVQYDARDLPIWNLLSGLPLPGTTIAKRSTIRIGGL
ncbi:MAG: TadE/TadG family type IV pilus assembly protein [Mesorhizobium sp.]